MYWLKRLRRFDGVLELELVLVEVLSSSEGWWSLLLLSDTLLMVVSSSSAGGAGTLRLARISSGGIARSGKGPM